MVFSSIEFLFFFAPVVYLCAYLAFRKASYSLFISVLILASLFFYGFWNPAFLWIIVSVVIVNYGCALLIHQTDKVSLGRLLVIAGVVFDLGVLFYFKYKDFFLSQFYESMEIPGFVHGLTNTMLPIGISFYTFQQIAFLADTYQKKIKHFPTFLEYSLFVSFFPQLIAGPIVHHSEVVPQFRRIAERWASNRYPSRYLAPGLFLLSVGLSKKILLADTFAIYADLGFSAAALGQSLSFIDSWGAALSYAYQIYFDFSGYSDMALGLGLLFCIKLPLNFHSPYKAQSISDFWRRWHITLSRFLRDYLYIPLGGNRHGTVRRHANLMTVMLVGGLWHGASWTFVAWGGLHGLALIVHRLWSSVVGVPLPRVVGWVLTFSFVVAAWVPFRADEFDTAIVVWRGMFGAEGIVLPASYTAVVDFFGPAGTGIGLQTGSMEHFGGIRQIALLVFGTFVVLALPCCSVAMLDNRTRRRYVNKGWFAWALGALSFASVLLIWVRESEVFLYYQF